MRISRIAFNEFRVNWRAALSSPSDIWDGYRAVEELRQAAYPVSGQEEVGSALNFIRCDPRAGWRPEEMLSGILAEVNDYKKKKSAWHKEFKDVELFLASIGRRAKRKCSSASNPELKALLKNTYRLLEKRRVAVVAYRNESAQSPLALWEDVSRLPTRMENIRRRTDLDTRLQIQSAKMLRNFLYLEEGVSLRTIARLIVLLYRVTGLAIEDPGDGCLKIRDSSRAISWRTVEDKLRRNKLR